MYGKNKKFILNTILIFTKFTLWKGIRYHESCLKEVGNFKQTYKKITEYIEKNHAKISKGSLTLFCVVLLFTLHCV